jgi:hypothetical protein
MKLRYVFVLLMATIALAYLLTPKPPSYSIKLDRRLKSGDMFTLIVQGNRKQTTTVRLDDKVKSEKESHYAFEFQGFVNVLAVDEQGQPDKQQVTVGRFVKKEDNGSDTTLIEPGSKITEDHSNGADPTYAIDSGELSKEAREGLTSILAGKGRQPFDRTFGNSSKVTPQTEWPVNTEEEAKFLTQNGLRINASNLSGTVKLIGVRSIDGVDCQQVWSTVRAENFAPPDTGDVTQIHTFDGFFPLDPEKYILAEGYKMELYANSKPTPEKLSTHTETIEETRVQRKFPMPAGKQ